MIGKTYITRATFARPRTFTLLENIQRTKYFRNNSSVASSLNNAKPYESIPGLSSLPIIGTLHHFLPVIGKVGKADNFVSMIGMFHKDFDSVVVKMDGVLRRTAMVILYEPAHFEQVFRSEETEPTRPSFEPLMYYKTVMRKDEPSGILGLTISQGAEWRDFRTKVNPALLKSKVITLYSPGIEEISKQMVARLKNLPSDYIQQNFDIEMKKFSLESIALVGLGDRLGCLEDDVAENHPSRLLMKSVQDIVKLGFILELFPILWRTFKSPTFKKLVKNMDTQWEISAMFIEKAKKRINERGHDIPDEQKSIIEKLLAVDERVAIAMANEMLMAGIDTVAFATTGLLYHLATNPEVQDKLRKQIASDDRNKRYLKACLKETLRLNPVITGQLRRTTKDHIVGGYHVPKGVDVVSPNEYLSKLEKYYPRPEEFIPERWLAEKNDPLYYGNAHPMVTMPFGYGVRTCIGRRIAELEILTFTQTLIKDNVVEWNGPPIKLVTHIMNTFKKPYHFSFKAL